MQCRTNRIYCSFLPSRIILWNALNPDIKMSNSLKRFKSGLMKDVSSKVAHYCNIMVQGS